MLKYVLSYKNQTIEFATLEQALEYKTLNNLSSEIQEITEEVVKKSFVPDITARQLRLGLLAANVSLSQVDEIINSLAEPERSYAQISWEYSTIFERNHELINIISAQMGLTPDQVDQIFINASFL